MSHKKVFFALILLAVITSGAVYFFTSEAGKNKKLVKCDYVLSDVRENRYQEDYDEYSVPCVPTSDSSGYRSIFSPFCPKEGKRMVSARHYTYWEVDGLLQNKLKADQYLKSIILKIYTNGDRKILLTENYLDVSKILTHNQSYPFQIRAQINRDDEMGRYFNSDDEVVVDVYPYFLSCR